MRGSEELRQTDDSTVYKRLEWQRKFKELGGCCFRCPLGHTKRQDLKSWKTNRKLQYHIVSL